MSISAQWQGPLRLEHGTRAVSSLRLLDSMQSGAAGSSSGCTCTVQTSTTIWLEVDGFTCLNFAFRGISLHSLLLMGRKKSGNLITPLRHPLLSIDFKERALYV